MQKIPYSLFTIKPLTSDTDLSSFSCSNHDLTAYLKEDAFNDKENLYSITKVVEYNGRIVGYFSLICDNIDVDKVDDEIGKSYKHRKLPAIKIARLATDKEFAGHGIGGFMMRHIFLIILNIIEDVGCRVISVDSKQDAQGFYEHFTFKTVTSKKKYSFIPMYLDVNGLIESLKD